MPILEANSSPQKQCSGCQSVYPVAEFPKIKYKGETRISARCLGCKRQSSREAYHRKIGRVPCREVRNSVKYLLRGKTLAATEVSIATLGRYRTFGSPFLFTAANWSATFYLEVYARATSGTLKARLYNLTDSTPVANSEVSTTSSTFTRLRSAAVSLVNGKEYVVQFGTVDGVGGFKAAKIIAI